MDSHNLFLTRTTCRLLRAEYGAALIVAAVLALIHLGQILAVILHDRHHLPQAAIAALCQIRPETLSRNISGIRRLLPQTGHTIQPSSRTLTTLSDLYAYAAESGITIPAMINAAC